MTRAAAAPRVVCFATKGAGTNEEARIVDLLADLAPVVYPFDRAAKIGNVARILRFARRERADLLVMEGTGLAGGLALVLARLLLRIGYVVSSGDAVGPYLGGRRRVLTLPGWLYEAVLYRLAAGFIGWTPYLAGRALTMGCARVMTAPHLADPEVRLSRDVVRRRLGVPDGAIVAGIVGSLNWNDRYGYCYGWELVSAVLRVQRDDVVVVVIGDGDGAERLRALAGPELGRRVFVPGPVEPELAVSHLAAMDIGSLPQSIDQAGGFRYTTKLPEYVAARLPVVTGQTPAAYDLMDGWVWRLPGDAPWDERYVQALAELLERVGPDEIAARRAAIPAAPAAFSASDQRRRAGAFARDVVDRRRSRRAMASAERRARSGGPGLGIADQ